MKIIIKQKNGCSFLIGISRFFNPVNRGILQLHPVEWYHSYSHLLSVVFDKHTITGVGYGYMKGR